MKSSKLASIRCFLFDMDGTIYLDGRLLPGAALVMGHLQELGIPFFYLTNNSSRARSDYQHKLSEMGLPASETQIITSGEATAQYLLSQKTGRRIFLAGTPALEREFTESGFQLVQDSPECVVLGFDMTLTYEKMRRLCTFVRAGLPFMATHPDINCPTENGPIPDIGAMIAFVEASTGRTPDVIIGKPHKPIVAVIVERTGLQPHEIAMVGDRLYTDIALGRAGLFTVLVLSGETKREDLPGAEYQPDVVVKDLAELYQFLI